jgi:hypothetical protein
VLTPDGIGRAPEPFAAAGGGTESGRAGVDSRPSRSREPRDDRTSRDVRVDEGPIYDDPIEDDIIEDDIIEDDIADNDPLGKDPLDQHILG